MGDFRNFGPVIQVLDSAKQSSLNYVHIGPVFLEELGSFSIPYYLEQGCIRPLLNETGTGDYQQWLKFLETASIGEVMSIVNFYLAEFNGISNAAASGAQLIFGTRRKDDFIYHFGKKVWDTMEQNIDFFTEFDKHWFAQFNVFCAGVVWEDDYECLQGDEEDGLHVILAFADGTKIIVQSEDLDVIYAYDVFVKETVLDDLQASIHQIIKAFGV